MKIIRSLFFTTVFMSSLNAQLSLGGTYNIDIYKPYTLETQEYIKINNQVSSATFGFHSTYKVLNKNRFSWETGLACKFIKQIEKERIRAYYDYNSSSGSFYYTEATLDLRSRSLSLGWKNDFLFTFYESSNFKNEFGLSNELYFLERFHSGYFYKNTKKDFESNNVHISTMNPSFFRFYASSVNLSLFYRFTWQQSEKFSLATKISLGTNLYSDWDQFQKYAWLSLGLELGFGKKKTKEIEN